MTSRGPIKGRVLQGEDSDDDQPLPLATAKVAAESASSIAEGGNTSTASHAPMGLLAEGLLLTHVQGLQRQLDVYRLEQSALMSRINGARIKIGIPDDWQECEDVFANVNVYATKLDTLKRDIKAINRRLAALQQSTTKLAQEERAWREADR